MTPFYEREPPPPPRGEQKEEENKLDQWLSEIFFILYTFDFNENSYGVKNTEGQCCATAAEKKQ